MTCIFCDIVAGRAPASFICRGERVSAFMALQPTAPGECLVIPNVHVDHFIDVHHLTSERFARIDNGEIVFDISRVPIADRDRLDADARLLSHTAE